MNQSTASGLTWRLAEGRAIITIDRPEKRNALSLNMLLELPQLLTSIQRSDATCVIISGGSTQFSSGFDLADLPPDGPDASIETALESAFEAVRRCPLPVIAAVEGACMGAGVELALACDLRVVATDAFFEVPAIRLGIRYRPNGIAAVATTIGQQGAVRLFGLGERITGAGALAAGIATTLCDPGLTLDGAMSASAKLAGVSPDLARHVKQVLGTE